ncbi:thioredoxin [Ligilactobacillus sp. WILCCON 0076]|uniref:Thioredoxin n=1 Tax=Ligilactobacillus ubinensis TaxID=2876789 RepID=A0A9X2FLM7_9LACO|nr:thioredoxin [Ligilactobacillus ubinensis]MCP0887630.1 thioredoxin [Ligilactobacillus ubinensis]
MAKKLTAKNIQQEVSKGLVLVDFWADWCNPCKMMNPVLDELEKKYHGQIKFAKVDVEKNRDVALKYDVMSIPTLLLFKDGIAKEKISGYRSQIAMEQYLDSKLSK